MAQHKRLLVIASFPLILVIISYVFGFKILLGTVEEMVLAKLSASALHSWISPLLFKSVLWLTSITAAGLLFSTALTIASIPFNDWLSESCESVIELSQRERERVRKGLSRKIPILFKDFLKTLLSIVWSLLALGLSLFPPLIPVSVILLALGVSYQFLSFAQSRRGSGALSDLGFVFNHFSACLGFGLGAGFLLSIPLLGALTLPWHVVAGTMLYAELTARD